MTLVWLAFFVPAQTPLFDIIDELSRQTTFVRDNVTQITARVKPTIRSVEVRTSSFAILEINTTPCIPPSDVMKRYGAKPEVQVSEPAAPYGFTYRYKQPWGSLAFEFSRGKECLTVVSLDRIAASIGVATMTADGTIIMDVRSQGAEARLVYHRGDKDYDEVLKHLGGLMPGEHKPVPPWPDR